jgi:hypothetical protein
MGAVIPLALVAAAVAAVVVFLRSEAARPRRRGLLVVVAVAAALAVLGVVPLLGIPGAVVYELFDPLVRAVLGRGYAELGAGAWAAAIVATLVWPSSLVLAYAVAYGPLRRRPAWVRWTVLVLVPCVAAAALAFWPHLAPA